MKKRLEKSLKNLQLAYDLILLNNPTQLDQLVALEFDRAGILSACNRARTMWHFSSPLMHQFFIQCLYPEIHGVSGPDSATFGAQLNSNPLEWPWHDLLQHVCRLFSSKVLAGVRSKNTSCLHERVVGPEFHASLRAILPFGFSLFPEMHLEVGSQKRLDELILNHKGTLIELKMGCTTTESIRSAAIQAIKYARLLQENIELVLVINFIYDSTVRVYSDDLRIPQVNVCTIIHNSDCTNWKVILPQTLDPCIIIG
eukprot:TRINITY_DN99_c0_g1_i10.p1 TRINITY_DN99_c0_g1~~TRINITY_DN99_c0_g1_i10.p1  ORF type:complete len:256 (+),score=15.88 TRINITY_DN99_c0_g1_i10:1317-2084(+)